MTQTIIALIVAVGSLLFTACTGLQTPAPAAPNVAPVALEFVPWPLTLTTTAPCQRAAGPTPKPPVLDVASAFPSAEVCTASGRAR